MPLHRPTFAVGEWGRLVEDEFGGTELAKVV
jgi:hypothetical protein